MNEFRLMASLLNKIKIIAAEERAQKVDSVSIWMGASAEVTAEHFKQSFTRDSAGTIIENAELIVVQSKDKEHPQAEEVLLKSLDVS